MIDVGAEAPNFTLPDQDGEPVELAALRGRPVVLYFYPKAERTGSKNSKPSEEGRAACAGSCRPG
ncbi:MAG: redoxin domain-containing protein [Solirubrobacteraceae bacterium]